MIKFILFSVYLPFSLGKSCIDGPFQLIGTNTDNECIFDLVKSNFTFDKSFIRTFVNKDEPNSQSWTYCRSCSFDIKGFGVNGLSPNHHRNYTIDATWSRWGEYFTELSLDDALQIKSYSKDYYISKINKGQVFYINRPVYILPIISIHPGHILVDAIQQIYDSMLEHYGHFVSNALIFITVSNRAENKILAEKITKHFYDSNVDTIGLLLASMSNLPIQPLSVLLKSASKSKMIIFEELHIGLDTTGSFLSDTHKRPFCLPPLESPIVKHITDRFQNFRKFLWKRLQLAGTADDSVAASTTSAKNPQEYTKSEMIMRNILIINRAAKYARSISNYNQVLDSLVDLKVGGNIGTIKTVILEGLKFRSQQLPLFHLTDIMVTVAGSAIHNAIFMRKGSGIVILMPPYWCKWGWMYAAQMLYLGIHARIVCINYQTESNHEYNTINLDSYNKLSMVRTSWSRGSLSEFRSNFTVSAKSIQLIKDAVLDLMNIFEASPGLASTWALYSYSQSSALNIFFSLSDSWTGCWSDWQRKIFKNKRAHPQNEVETLNKISKFEPPVMVTISSVKIERAIGKNSGVSEDTAIYYIQGSLFLRQDLSPIVLKSFYHLSVCIGAFINKKQKLGDHYDYDNSELDPVCVSLQRLNYHAHLELDMPDLPLVIHAWLQSSSKTGKLHGSDCYIALSATRIENNDSTGGFLALKKPPIVSTGTDAQMHSYKNTEFVLYSDWEGYTPSQAHEGQIHDSEVNVVLRIPWSTPEQWQMQLNHFCNTDPYYSPPRCARIASLLTQQVVLTFDAWIRGLPPPLSLPSQRHPFIFLHVDKCAGSTMRALIANSTARLGFHSLIPCSNVLMEVSEIETETKFQKLKERNKPNGETNGTYIDPKLVPCELFSLHASALTVQPHIADTLLKNLSVLAGHFQWGEWRHLYQINNKMHTEVKETKVFPSCFLMLRQPATRAISFYNQRLASLTGYKEITDLDKNDLNEVLTVYRGGKQPVYLNEHVLHGINHYKKSNSKNKKSNIRVLYPKIITDDGISNGICKTLLRQKHTTGFSLNYILDSIKSGDYFDYDNQLNSNTTLWNLALTRAEKCVIGLQEQMMKTYDVLSLWYPWLATELNFEKKARKPTQFMRGNSMRMGMKIRKEKELKLNETLVKYIEEYNQCDVYLYKTLLPVFWKQYQLVVSNKMI